jgi:hypothetical protein
MFAPTLLAHAALLAQLAVPPASSGYPFDVGEKLRYDVKLGFVPIGTATATVAQLTKERGTEAFVFTAVGEGGPPGAHVSYALTSWVGKARFESLRFYRRMVQRKTVEEDRFQIVPDSLRYRREGTRRDWAAPPHPLDELAFLYYLRTMSLQVGKSYTLSRYFQTGYNPVALKVTGRPTLKLPDGRSVPCFALVLTSRGNTLNVWLTDDARRLPVQLEIPFWFGNARLKLAE